MGHKRSTVHTIPNKSMSNDIMTFKDKNSGQKESSHDLDRSHIRDSSSRILNISDSLTKNLPDINAEIFKIKKSNRIMEESEEDDYKLMDSNPPVFGRKYEESKEDSPPHLSSSNYKMKTKDNHDRGKRSVFNA